MIDILNFISLPFSSIWYTGNLLNKMSLFLIASSGSVFALKSGSFNLGGEVQLYAPALLSAVLLSSPFALSLTPYSLTSFLFFSSVLLAACLLGALLSGFSGFLHARYGTSELLTSFLLSQALLPVLDYLISGPLRDKGKNLLATKPIAHNFRLPSFLPPSLFNITGLFALVICIVLFLFFLKTGYGYRLGITGKAPEFARFTGFPVKRMNFIGMAVSGALHGLTGFFAITGTWFMCHQGITSGMGWSALAIALIARQNFLLLIPASFIYAWIESASNIAVLSSNINFDSTAIIQGLIFLFVSAQFFPKFKNTLLARMLKDKIK